ncbi:16879_t:CDS:1 [Racocetra persica]|uniref:16879_t:CDS:1 n=1 Tax=Racocetra persica TaxID=160502 RepID=A0ACA9L8B3_9GLOM|nr:16879_t:CDS:1 [Racocetra persica]
MAQTIFKHLSNGQKTETKHIYFQKGNNQPSLLGEVLNVYDYFNSEQLKGELDLALFPNLRKITFQQDARFNILESIDLSQNEKLSRIVIDGQNNDYFFEHNSFTLLIKEIQLSRIILAYDIKDYRGTRWVWIKITNYLKDQAIIPYFLVEDKKIEQLEAEVASLKQSLAQKDQTIAQKDQTIAQNDRTIVDLNKKIQQTPTFDQFQELNNIALVCSDLDFDFDKLKQEVKRLKLKDFNPYFREQKDSFEQLTTTTKNKAGDNLCSILDLLLQTNKQIIESKNESDDSFTQGQLRGQLLTCQTLLQTKFTTEELQSLLNKQKELLMLEKQFAILKQ